MIRLRWLVILLFTLSGCLEFNPMGVVICSPFNDDLNLCKPSTISPSEFWDTELRTDRSKFGAGSAGGILDSDGLFLRYTSGLSSVGNEGALGIWIYSESDYIVMTFEERRPFFGQLNNFVRINIADFDLPDEFGVTAHIWDSAGVDIGLSAQVANRDRNAWTYLELNWLWNDASGISELSVNGTVVDDSTAGNTLSRSVETGHHMEISGAYTSGTEKRIYVDDPVISNTRLNVGNFSVPTGPQCICAVPGWNRFGGEFNNWNRFGG